jgi:hypothetical protein
MWFYASLSNGIIGRKFQAGAAYVRWLMLTRFHLRQSSFARRLPPSLKLRWTGLRTGASTFAKAMVDKTEDRQRPLARWLAPPIFRGGNIFFSPVGSFTPVQSALRPSLPQILFATSQVAQIPSASNVFSLFFATEARRTPSRSAVRHSTPSDNSFNQRLVAT